MSATLRIAALVPVHGWAPYLAETLDAVLAEAPDHVVVVDDGSPDPLVLHPDHAPHVELVRHEHRRGLPAARATAATHARSAGAEAVALCDADDTWWPGHLAASRAALDAHPATGATFGAATVIDASGLPTGGALGDLPPPGEVLDAKWLFIHNPGAASSAVIRIDELAAAGGFASRLDAAEDWDLWLRLTRAGWPLRHAPGAGVRFRRHAGGMSDDIARLARAQACVHREHAASAAGPATVRASLECDRAEHRRAMLRARLRSVPGAGSLRAGLSRPRRRGA